MKILAIDSSGLVASVAVVEDNKVLGEYSINDKKTHSQTLLPMLDALVRLLGLDLAEIDAIAVAKGPGSFTGLRIGSATAKGLGLALDKPIVEVPTVDALAYNLCAAEGVVVPMMDARRDQVYTGIYRFAGQKMTVIHAQWAAPVTELAEELNRIGEPVVFLGDGVRVYLEKMKEILQVPFLVAPPHLRQQRAGAVGALGLRYFAEGKTVDAEKHVPEYLRISQAERERLAQKKSICANPSDGIDRLEPRNML